MLKRELLLAAALLIASCGGGGSSGGTVTSNTDPLDCGQTGQCTVDPGDIGTIRISVPESGMVVSASGERDCGESSECMVEVTDSAFFETFTAVPEEGFIFAGWLNEEPGLCGGSLDPCSLGGLEVDSYPDVMDIIESEEAFVLTPQFLPDDEIRRYMPGDLVYFTGTISGIDGLAVGDSKTVEAQLEILPLDAVEGEFPVMDARLVVSDQERELSDWQVQFWQGASGTFYELTDEYRNILLDTGANSEGIASIPVPLVAYAETEVQFSAMWGGHTSTPLTGGERSIRIGEQTIFAAKAGELSVYPVNIADQYSYLVSFGDFKIGSTPKQASCWVQLACHSRQFIAASDPPGARGSTCPAYPSRVPYCA
jgi:hypothetical protein